jgi:hypothetical protein
MQRKRVQAGSPPSREAARPTPPHVSVSGSTRTVFPSTRSRRPASRRIILSEVHATPDPLCSGVGVGVGVGVDAAGAGVSRAGDESVRWSFESSPQAVERSPRIVTRTTSELGRSGGWTRAGLLRTAVGAGAVVAGGVTMGSRGGGSSLAAQQEADAEILNFFLLLEYVQEGFYRETTEKAQINGDLLTFVQTVSGQESEHVSFLEDWLGDRARDKPALSFADATGSPDTVQETAIYLEEAALAGYIGQGANLSHRTITKVGTLVSAEARQAAWVRNIAGMSPAPRAADPAREADAVVADLRKRGYIE